MTYKQGSPREFVDARGFQASRGSNRPLPLLSTSFIHTTPHNSTTSTAAKKHPHAQRASETARHLFYVLRYPKSQVCCHALQASLVSLFSHTNVLQGLSVCIFPTILLQKYQVVNIEYHCIDVHFLNTSEVIALSHIKTNSIQRSLRGCARPGHRRHNSKEHSVSYVGSCSLCNLLPQDLSADSTLSQTSTSVSNNVTDVKL